MASGTGPIKVLHFGLGPIGAAVVKQVADRKGFKIVGAVDIDPAKVGQRPRRGRRRRPHAAGQGVRRCEEGDQVDQAGRRRAVHQLVDEEGAAADGGDPQAQGRRSCRRPRSWRIRPRATCATRGPSTSSRRRPRSRCSGPGSTPGSSMDALPITLTGVCERVEALRIDRVQDARIRRLPFQQKIGAGLTREQFQRKVDEGSVRHVGLAESVSMIADALGWKLDRITDEIQPRIATADGGERVPRRRRRLCLRHRAGWHRLPQRRAGHHAAHGGLPRRARVVRLGRGHRVAGPQDEDRRRRPRRHRHRVDRRQLAARRSSRSRLACTPCATCRFRRSSAG